VASLAAHRAPILVGAQTPGTTGRVRVQIRAARNAPPRESLLPDLCLLTPERYCVRVAIAYTFPATDWNTSRPLETVGWPVGVLPSVASRPT
jgi:hypothetical protein